MENTINKPLLFYSPEKEKPINLIGTFPSRTLEILFVIQYRMKSKSPIHVHFSEHLPSAVYMVHISLSFCLTREVLELAPWYRSKSISNRLGILENGPMQKIASWASCPLGMGDWVLQRSIDWSSRFFWLIEGPLDHQIKQEIIDRLIDILYVFFSFCGVCQFF